MTSLLVLKKYLENLKSESLSCHDKIKRLELEIEQCEFELSTCLIYIQEIESTIKLLEENDESTSKSKETK